MKFRIPKQYETGPHTITVQRCPLANAVGEFEPMALEERITPGIAEALAVETHIHEVIECANWLYELNLPHRTIQTLGAAIAQALKTGR